MVIAKLGLSAIERILKRIVIDSSTGCWNWPGATAGGYGRIRFAMSEGGKKVLTHRVTYEYYVGKIPKGLELDHAVCNNPLCCNPEHVSPVTHAGNMARGAHAMKACCKHGHPLVAGNLYVKKGNPRSRQCRKCHLAAVSRYAARQKGR